MKLHWTAESDGSIILRPAPNCARAIVKRADEWGFVGVVLEPGLPTSGPYKSRTTAAEFCQRILKEQFILDAEFGEIPKFKDSPAHKNIKSSTTPEIAVA